jgi:heme a synthase
MALADYPIRIAADAQGPAVSSPAPADVRGYFLLLFGLSLGAFVLGVENRITSDGLFALRPPVDWIPPLSAQDWWVGFTLHQQDPVFAACGGTDTLADFKTLYWWEWLRRLCLMGVATTVALGLLGAGLWQRYRAVLPRLALIGMVLLAYWSVRTLVDVAVAHVDALSSYNVGQYRHAVDVAFASALAALVLAAAVAAPGHGSRSTRTSGRLWEWLWLGFVFLDIGFGALFAARDAAAAWTTWPGYQGGALPPLDQLLAYKPLWLNLTFNPYTIQIVHRTVSAGLWIAALWQLVSAIGRVAPNMALVRFLLVTGQMLTGIATLLLGVPAILSIAHQVGSIFLLTCSFVVLSTTASAGQGRRPQVPAGSAGNGFSPSGTGVRLALRISEMKL